MTNTQSPAPGVAAELDIKVSKLMRRVMECIRCPASLDARKKLETDLYAALQASAAAVEPTYWQWRKKDEPWSLEKTFNSEVFATTGQTEVRGLYTAPPLPAQVQAAEVSEANSLGQPADLELIIDEYVDAYEMLGEDDQGRDGYYTPNDHEKGLLKDAIMGLLADTDWDAAWGAHIDNLVSLHTPAPGMAGGVVFKGPNKWADEEVADRHRGIRWITLEGVQGRPTSHDVMGYLQQRGEAAYCNCAECNAFFAAPHPSPAVQVAQGLSLEQKRQAWANMQADARGEIEG